MPTTNASFRTDPATLAALDSLAKEMGRSRNWAINKAVESFVEYNQWYLAQVAEGVAAAEAGDFAEDSEISAIFNKYGA